MEELVFAVPSDKLWELIPYKEEGFINGSSEVLKQIIHYGMFGKRSELEDDTSFKQLISYAILSHADSCYLFKRSSGQTEKRLHNKFTLGVGGHMNPGSTEDRTEAYVLNELKRELFEEVKLLSGCSIEDIAFYGFINDDTIPVGMFHIGLLYNIHLSSKHIAVNEPDKMTADWVEKRELSTFYESMETWSRIAYDSHIK